MALTSALDKFLGFKPYLLASIALFLLLASMALEPKQETRVVLLLPALVLYAIALSLFGLQITRTIRRKP